MKNCWHEKVFITIYIIVNKKYTTAVCNEESELE